MPYGTTLAICRVCGHGKQIPTARFKQGTKHYRTCRTCAPTNQSKAQSNRAQREKNRVPREDRPPKNKPDQLTEPYMAATANFREWCNTRGINFRQGLMDAMREYMERHD